MQARFVDEYLVDLNATQAAVRAGYSRKTAEVQGSRLLRNVQVAAAIRERQQKRSDRVQVDADYVVQNLTEVVERCMERAPVMVRDGNKWKQAEDDEGRSVWQFDARGAIGGLTLLGKHVGLFTEKHEHTVVDLSPDDRQARLLTILSAAKARRKA